MAMRMNHCASCQKHFFLTATTCPHCGAEAEIGPVSRFVRQARMGGLMLFTALTTTACYGTPAMMAPDAPLRTPGTAEPIDKHVPQAAGNAFVFITPKGQTTEAKETVPLGLATVSGAILILQSRDGKHRVMVEAPTEDAFKAGTGVREAVDVSQMKALEVHSSFPSGTGGERTNLDWVLPGDTPITGVLQLAKVTEEAISGTLLLQSNGQSVQIYFNAAF